MRLRQYSWMARAAHEQAFATKTWFITLTYGPVRRRAILSAASRDNSRLGTDQRLIKAAGAYVSTYFKHLRKKQFALRYVCVPELHRDGFPHWHGLVHDLRGDITWDDLNAGWSPGFSVVKIVRDAKALRYVTKYLSKGKIGKVRSSLHYGDPKGEKRGDPPNATEGSEGGKGESLEKEKEGVI